MISISLALGAALAWGIGDFLGGVTSRRLRLLTVLIISQAAGFFLVAAVVVVRAVPPPPTQAAVFAALAGVFGLIGLASFYRGMAVGSISVVAPISATGAIIPVLWSIAVGERASPFQTAGIALALAGIVLVSRASSDKPPTGHSPPSGALPASNTPSPMQGEATGAPLERLGGPADAASGSGTTAILAAKSRRGMGAGVGLALLAAAGFGAFFIAMRLASEADVFWAATIQRGTSAAILIIIGLTLRTSLAAAWGKLTPLLVIGVFDVSANVLYAAASVTGLTGIAAVLSSLYPVVPVLLARLLLHERISVLQQAGVVSALAGIGLIAVK